jgi:hypothetical protein
MRGSVASTRHSCLEVAGAWAPRPQGASDSAGFHPHSSRASPGGRCTLGSVRSGAAISATASRASRPTQSPGSGGESSACERGGHASFLTGFLGGLIGSDGRGGDAAVGVVERVVGQAVAPDAVEQHRQFSGHGRHRLLLGGATSSGCQA